MSMLLKSGMSLNLATGQIFLTQNISDESASEESTSENVTTDTATTDGQLETEAGSESVDGTEIEGENTSEAATVDETEAAGEEGTTEEGTISEDGEASLDGEVTEEGEMATDDEIIMDDGTAVTTDGMDLGVDDGFYDEMYAGMETGDGTQVKDPLLSNWFFVIGISAATLVVSIALGILLAKKRIKKGIELYED